MEKNIKRGDIFYTDLSPSVGSEQGGVRPVIIIQNNVGNKYSPTVIVAAITSKINKAKLPTHVEISKKYTHDKDSVILLEQIRTLDKRRLMEKVGSCDEFLMNKIDNALLTSIGVQFNNQPQIKVDEKKIKRMEKYIDLFEDLKEKNVNDTRKYVRFSRDIDTFKYFLDNCCCKNNIRHQPLRV
jgi:mRNA interferase MazF